MSAALPGLARDLRAAAAAIRAKDARVAAVIDREAQRWRARIKAEGVLHFYAAPFGVGAQRTDDPTPFVTAQDYVARTRSAFRGGKLITLKAGEK